MAKRFLDTNFLSQAWIRKLLPEQKCFLIYLMLECDNGGIIDLDLEATEFWIGKKIGDPLKFLPNGYLIFIQEPGKFFLPKFILYQYSDLSSNKNIVVQARQILKRHGLINKDFTLKLPKSYLKVTQNLPESQVTSIGIGKGNSKGKGKEGESEGGKFKIIFPWTEKLFIDTWDLWKSFKKEQFKFTYKPIGEQGALHDLAELSGGELQIAIAIIHQSIKKGWRGFFELKVPQGQDNISYAEKLKKEMTDEFK